MELLLFVIAIVLAVAHWVMGYSIRLGIMSAYLYNRWFLKNHEHTGARFSPWFAWITSLLSVHVGRVYYRYSWHGSDHTGRQVIMAAHPHGIINLPTYYLFCEMNQAQIYDVVPCVHSAIFRIPVYREIMLALGYRDVSRDTLERALDEGKSIYLVPGGTAEMAKRGASLNQAHQGFLKLAYTRHLPVMPVLHLGLDDVFPWVWQPRCDALRAFCQRWIGHPFPTFFLGPLPARLTTWFEAPIDPVPCATLEEFCTIYWATVQARLQRRLEERT
jgi:1-acyl-sn-glycerol-3-phosphate acyltransferase